MTFPHFAISVLIQSAKCSGVLATGSKPSAEQALPEFGRRDDACDRAVEQLDDLARRSRRSQEAGHDVRLEIGPVASAMVGTSGSSEERLALIIASARTLPALHIRRARR